MDQATFDKKRRLLLSKVDKLRKQGKILENSKGVTDKKKGIDGWVKRKKFSREMKNFEA